MVVQLRCPQFRGSCSMPGLPKARRRSSTRPPTSQGTGLRVAAGPPRSRGRNPPPSPPLTPRLGPPRLRQRPRPPPPVLRPPSAGPDLAPPRIVALRPWGTPCPGRCTQPLAEFPPPLAPRLSARASGPRPQCPDGLLPATRRVAGPPLRRRLAKNCQRCCPAGHPATVEGRCHGGARWVRFAWCAESWSRASCGLLWEVGVVRRMAWAHVGLSQKSNIPRCGMRSGAALSHVIIRRTMCCSVWPASRWPEPEAIRRRCRVNRAASVDHVDLQAGGIRRAGEGGRAGGWRAFWGRELRLSRAAGRPAPLKDDPLLELRVEAVRGGAGACRARALGQRPCDGRETPGRLDSLPELLLGCWRRLPRRGPGGSPRLLRGAPSLSPPKTNFVHSVRRPRTSPECGSAWQQVGKFGGPMAKSMCPRLPPSPGGTKIHGRSSLTVVPPRPHTPPSRPVAQS